jgi:hypothetical protein
MASSGMLRRVALVRADVSEGLSASLIRVTRIGEPGTTFALTSNRRKQRINTYGKSCSRFTDSCHSDEGGAKFLRIVSSY